MNDRTCSVLLGTLTLISALFLALHLFVLGASVVSMTRGAPIRWLMLLSIGPPLAIGLCVAAACSEPAKKPILRINAAIALIHLWTWLAFGPIRLLDNSLSLG